MARLQPKNLQKTFIRTGTNPSLLLNSKYFKYFFLGGVAAGAPIATFLITSHLLNSRNQRILEEKERIYEALLAENTSTKEEITVPKEEEIQETIVVNTTIPQDVPKETDDVWTRKEEEYKSKIKIIEESKKNLETKIKRKIWDFSEVLTPKGLTFFKKSKFISAWENLTRIESTGGRSSGALFNSSMHYEEAFDLFWHYKSYEYSSGKDLMKYLVPGDWYLLKSSGKVRLYFFLLNPYTEIKKIVEALRETHSGSGHSSFGQHNYLNEYMKPFAEQKERINKWNQRITVQFLANSYRHNVFNSPLHPSSHNWWNPGNYKIKPIEKLDIGEIFKSKEDIHIALRILFFLHLTSQYTLAKTVNNHVSFGIGDSKKAALSFFSDLYANKLTIKTNNFPSAESFLHYLILKVLEYKNNFGKVNLIDSVHPAFFSK